MRTAPRSIIVQQRRYILAIRLWTCLPVLASLVALVPSLTVLLEFHPSKSIKMLIASAAACAWIGMLLLKPRKRIDRYREASNLLTGNILRYEIGESVTATDLMKAAQEANQLVLAQA